MFKKLLIFTLIMLSIIGCKKDNIEFEENDSPLSFSANEITFDTVFATIGSITKTLKVFNNNKYDLSTDIILRGITEANFRMNIDGVSGNNQKNIIIPAKDSIFIFIEVTINPSDNLTPYILTDSIIFKTNSALQDVDLIAWGQDAHFHLPDTMIEVTIGDNTFDFHYHRLKDFNIWDNDKPHVIYGYVMVEDDEELIIQSEYASDRNTNIYLHKNSGIIVGNPFNSNIGGSLKVYGSELTKVTFQGDRLDDYYSNPESAPAGQWDKIWLSPGSVDNVIENAIIKNATIGIHTDTNSNTNPTLLINNTIIDNMSMYGILGQGAYIEAYNLLITKCGERLFAGIIGGTYKFIHCTFANYWEESRNTASILLNNFYLDNNSNIQLRNLIEASFTNCIIYGNNENEIELQNNDNAQFNFEFLNSLIKIKPFENSDNYINTLTNQSPKFISNKDFHLKESSPAIDYGVNTQLTYDIENNPRTDGYPDVGAYEYP